jgi:hypothetical protein
MGAAILDVLSNGMPSLKVFEGDAMTPALDLVRLDRAFDKSARVPRSNASPRDFRDFRVLNSSQPGGILRAFVAA